MIGGPCSPRTGIAVPTHALLLDREGYSKACEGEGGADIWLKRAGGVVDVPVGVQILRRVRREMGKAVQTGRVTEDPRSIQQTRPPAWT